VKKLLPLVVPVKVPPLAGIRVALLQSTVGVGVGVRLGVGVRVGVGVTVRVGVGVAAQSPSFKVVHPAGQHPSPPMHPTGVPPPHDVPLQVSPTTHGSPLVHEAPSSGVHVEGRPLHCQHNSIWQVALHPSPPLESASSHVSPGSSVELPHGFGPTVTVQVRLLVKFACSVG
jgi:hypothetical protein